MTGDPPPPHRTRRCGWPSLCCTTSRPGGSLAGAGAALRGLGGPAASQPTPRNRRPATNPGWRSRRAAPSAWTSTGPARSCGCCPVATSSTAAVSTRGSSVDAPARSAHTTSSVRVPIHTAPVSDLSGSLHRPAVGTPPVVGRRVFVRLGRPPRAGRRGTVRLPVSPGPLFGERASGAYHNGLSVQYACIIDRWLAHLQNTRH